MVCQDLLIDPETFSPDFYLQKGERVIHTLKCTKRWLNPLLAAILTIITLGLFLLVKNAFKKVKVVQVIVLTNKRVMEYTYRPRDKSHFTSQSIYALTSLTFYQHEIVQDEPLCFGCIKTRPYTTARLFFDKYPTVMPPSYNSSPALSPVVMLGASAIKSAVETTVNALAHNLVGAIQSALELAQKLVKFLTKIFQIFGNYREEERVPGFYIEIDTNDKGSVESVNQFLQKLNDLYPRRDILRTEPNMTAVNRTNAPGRLWEDGQPINLTQLHLNTTVDEQIFDGVKNAVNITLWDWILAVVTLGLYYFFVIKDLKGYRGAFIVTDRRFVSIYAHSERGLVENAKYLQMTKCWFFRSFDTVVAYSHKPAGILGLCFGHKDYSLMVDCGFGSIELTPDYKIGEDRIYAFFNKFFLPREAFLNIGGADKRGDSDIEMPKFAYQGDEGIVYAIASRTDEDCAFNCTRLMTCGTAPPLITNEIAFSTHKLFMRFTFSDGCTAPFASIAIFTNLRNVRGFQFNEAKIKGGCSCCDMSWMNMSILFHKGSDWSAGISFKDLVLDSEKVKEAGRAFSYVTTTVDDEFQRNCFNEARPMFTESLRAAHESVLGGQQQVYVQQVQPKMV